MIVQYSKFPSVTPGISSYWRPVLVVKFSSGSKNFSAPCIVDSGADHTLLNKDFAAQLGLTWNKGGVETNTYGIDGIESKIYLHEINLEVINLKGSKTRSLVGFVDLKIQILLGQIGFFEHFAVRFKRNALVFAIDPL